MELINQQSMLISEHKRTSYDKEGAVEKIDILRSIRRKDAEPSFLPSFLTEKDSKQQNPSGQNKFKDIMEYFLIATIIFCTLLLIMSTCGISIQVNTDSILPQQNKKQQSQQTLNNSFLLSNLNHSLNLPNNSLKFRTIQEAIAQFQTTLHNQLLKLKTNGSQSQKTQLLNLNEFTKLITQNDHNLLEILLSNFAQTLNCKIQSNKIICQHDLLL